MVMRFMLGFWPEGLCLKPGLCRRVVSLDKKRQSRCLSLPRPDCGFDWSNVLVAPYKS